MGSIRVSVRVKSTILSIFRLFRYHTQIQEAWSGTSFF